MAAMIASRSSVSDPGLERRRLHIALLQGIYTEHVVHHQVPNQQSLQFTRCIRVALLSKERALVCRGSASFNPKPHLRM